jgi:hypothetical protein
MYLTCCKIVGVKPGADIEAIKSAYRKSAKELHPDVNSSSKAHDYFIILQNAYQYLLEHPYIPEKSANFSATNKKSNFSRRSDFKTASFSQVYHFQRYTLREVLKNSLTARILYIFFHILFLLIGFFMIIRSVYDILFFAVDERTDPVSAYISIFFAILFGIIITSVFLYTGYIFIRER